MMHWLLVAIVSLQPDKHIRLYFVPVLPKPCHMLSLYGVLRGVFYALPVSLLACCLFHDEVVLMIHERRGFPDG